ncbi:hypothetical protein BH09DEP1_BH09DEP1_8530 [soil metagenome]
MSRISQFFRTPAGIASIAFLCWFFTSLFVATPLRLIGAATIGSFFDYFAPTLAIALYVACVCKEKLSSALKLKSALYLTIIAAFYLAFIVYMVKSFIHIPWLSAFIQIMAKANSTAVQLLYMLSNPSITAQMMGWAVYLIILLSFPLALLWNYIAISLGNALGGWFLSLRSK